MGEPVRAEQRETGPEAWQRCRGWIEAALQHASGAHTIEDIEAAIEAGTAQFWPSERAAIVTQIWHEPKLKTLNFWLGGGDLKELLKMRPFIEAWAVTQGCRMAVGGGVRPEWGRFLAKYGYSPRWIVFAKDLTE